MKRGSGTYLHFLGKKNPNAHNTILKTLDRFGQGWGNVARRVAVLFLLQNCKTL